MNREELMEKFKDKNISLVFQHYYKYVFNFVGLYEEFDRELNKTVYYKFECGYGGNSDDIYRYEVDTRKPVPFIEEYWCNYISVKQKIGHEEDWKEIYYEYTY